MEKNKLWSRVTSQYSIKLSTAKSTCRMDTVHMDRDANSFMETTKMDFKLVPLELPHQLESKWILIKLSLLRLMNIFLHHSRRNCLLNQRNLAAEMIAHLHVLKAMKWFITCSLLQNFNKMINQVIAAIAMTVKCFKKWSHNNSHTVKY